MTDFRPYFLHLLKRLAAGEIAANCIRPAPVDRACDNAWTESARLALLDIADAAREYIARMDARPPTHHITTAHMRAALSKVRP